MVWKVVAGWEKCGVPGGATAGLVLIKAVDAVEEQFRHVWLVDERDVSVADKEQDDWMGWFGGDSVGVRLASGSVVLLSRARLLVYEIGQHAIA